jgi:hypothetical protein
VSLGDLVSEQVVEVVLRLSFPYGQLGQETGMIVAVTDQDGVFARGTAGRDPIRVTWTYATDRDNDVQTRDRDVDRAVARLFAARARQEAIRLNRAGEFDAAQRVLMATRRRIERYAGGDPEILAVLGMLDQEQVVYAAPMAEASRKQAYYSSANMLRSRDVQGRSVRRS